MKPPFHGLDGSQINGHDLVCVSSAHEPMLRCRDCGRANSTILSEAELREFFQDVPCERAEPELVLDAMGPDGPSSIHPKFRHEAALAALEERKATFEERHPEAQTQ